MAAVMSQPLTNEPIVMFCCPLNKKFRVIEILKYFESCTKSGGYMEGIWRLNKDDWRLSIEDGGYSKDLEVIYEVWRLYLEYGGYMKQG